MRQTMQTMIVPLDGSVCAVHALPFARAAARTFGGRLVLLRAMEGERPSSQPSAGLAGAKAASLSDMDGLVQMLGREGIAAEAEVRWGSPAIAIRAAAAAHQAGLIVMASHQRHGLNRWLHGSVAEAVLRGTPVPVLIVPHAGAPVPPDGSPLRVLVPLDGSAFAEVALDTVRQLAASRRVEVLLISVTRLRVAMIGDLTAYPIDPVDNLHETEAALRRIAVSLESDGIPTRVSVVETQQATVDEILALADRERVHTIVMATHGRGALAHLALGSVSTAVLEHSPIPVLLVPGRAASPSPKRVAASQPAATIERAAHGAVPAQELSD